MKIKKIVKTMNFQTLLHINAAKKKAEIYQNVGEEITEIIRRIVYNKNLVLDKKIIEVDETKPELNIYIANDYGFCGDFNASIRHQILKDSGAHKIIIGKKIITKTDNVVMKMDKSDFKNKISDLENVIYSSLNDVSYSKINLYYNHYYSMGSYEFKKIQLFPVEFKGTYYEGKDYVSETNIERMLKGLLSFYICYQIKIAEAISIASENVLRNIITNMALDKIEEKEKIIINLERKEKLNVTVMKNVENFKRILEDEQNG